MKEFEINDGILTKYYGEGGSVVVPDGVMCIAEDAFFNCTNITSVVLPQGITSIGARAFKCCDSIEKLTLPESITSIGSEAFAYCFKLSCIDLPDSIASINNSAFSFCETLGSINCYETENSEKFYTSKDGILYTQDEKTLVCCPARAVSGLFEVPKGIINIASHAFKGCSELKKLILPESIMNIGDDAISYCDSVISVDLPDSVASIGKKVFLLCEQLDAINCYKTPNKEKHYRSKDGILYTKDGKTLVCYPTGKVSSSYIVPKGVKFIGAFAFVGNLWIKHVSLPEGLLNIGEGAFSECVELQDITIPKSVTTIEHPAFLEDRCFVIQGVTDSYAEIYAKENNIKFEGIE